MPIVLASIAPHGDEIVPELNPNMDDKSERLMRAMNKLADEIFRKDPDIIVIATPHNLRIYKHIGVITTSYVEGTWGTEHGSIHVKATCDRDFALRLYENAVKNNLPAVAVNYGVDRGELSKMCLDWGTIIPLWFIEKRYRQAGKNLPPVVVITPSREIPWDLLVKFGEIIVDVSDNLGRNVVFIASADQSHTHDPSGPYGYDETSKEFDEFVLRAVKENRLEDLLNLSPEIVERAKPDSLWQMLILHGVIKKTNLRNSFTVYECPTYFGMLVAIFK